MLIVETILLVYFAYVASYALVFSVAAYTYRPFVKGNAGRNKFCVLIPSYKEDQVIVDVATEALRQDYPQEDYSVVVIADSLQTSTLAKLRQLPIAIHEVSFHNSTKVKSLNSALAASETLFDAAVILDADNVMHSSFLARMNDALNAGYLAVQGQRKPKNQENTLSFLDGVSEAINNHIYRQGSVALGMSASINGSGVVFNYGILKAKLSDMNSVGGFDRELELRLLEDGIPVYYHKEAIVFDEKTSRGDVFENQRKRWISSQYFYLRKYFLRGIELLARGNFTYFNSSILRNIQLPRLINLGLLTACTVVACCFYSHMAYGYVPWVVLFSANSAAILLAIPSDMYSCRLFTSLLVLPRLFTNMFTLLFKLNGANKKFLHTPHGTPPDNRFKK